MIEGQNCDLHIRPMQWDILPELHEALPLDEADLACLADVKAALARHGKLDRFAIQLAHRHFDVADGEILIEQPDPVARTQHVSVGRPGDHPCAIATTWLFEDGPELRLSDAIHCVCMPVNPGDNCARHGKSGVPSGNARRERSQKETGKSRRASISRSSTSTARNPAIAQGFRSQGTERSGSATTTRAGRGKRNVRGTALWNCNVHSSD